MSDLALLRGHCIVVDSLSVDLGGFRELVRAEAVAYTLAQQFDMRALVDHDTGKIIGRVSAGTLRVRQDRIGLACEIDVPDTTAGADVLESVARGDLAQMSYSFKTVEDLWREGPEGGVIREMLKLLVLEASIVAFPAYEDTEIDVVAGPRQLAPSHHVTIDATPSRANEEYAWARRPDGEPVKHEEAIGRREHFLAERARYGPGVRLRFDGFGRPTLIEPPRVAAPPRATPRTNWAFWATEESTWP
jgi:HK97 family phage prohead protease